MSNVSGTVCSVISSNLLEQQGIIQATLKPGGILLPRDRLPSPGSNDISTSPTPILVRGSSEKRWTSSSDVKHAAIPQIFEWFVTPLWTAKLWNHAPITSHLICITLITTDQATLSVNANLLINKLIRQLQLCRRMPKWNMTTQSLSTAPVGLFRCHNEKHDDKVLSLH